MRKNFVFEPMVWLLAQGACLLVACATLDYFEVCPIDIDTYALTLRDFEDHFLAGKPTGILADQRTLGYPFFALAVKKISPSLTALPFCQMVVRVLSVWVFYAGLRRVQFGGWLSLCMATTLYYANNVFSTDFCPRVTQLMTDSVGESLLIMTIGLLLFVLARPALLWPWAALTAALFLTYQVRPAFQFLVVLCPVLGFVLLGLVARGEWVRNRWKVGAGLTAACLLPFLAWCSFRLVMVNHFGLVSFTGNAMAGIAGLILTSDDTLVQELPQEHQEFARALLKRRDDILAKRIPATFGPWQAAFDEDGILVPNITDDNGLYIFAQYDLFQLVADTEFHDDRIAADNKQGQVAAAILRARPSYYAQWVIEALWLTPIRILTAHVVFFYLFWGLVALALVWHLVYVYRWIQGGPEAVAHGPRGGNGYLWELHVMLVLAIPVAAAQAVLVGALIAYLPRYYDTAAVFFPPTAVAAFAAIGARILALVRYTASPEMPPEPAAPERLSHLAAPHQKQVLAGG